MDILPRLKEIVGEENVSDEPGDLITYGLDWTRFFEPDPIAIVFVRTTQQVIKIVQLAREKGLGLVPSGGRTGLSGGACATNGEVVVCFERMNQILDFSSADASVTVQPGVITANLQAFAKEQGLYYPVDFASSGSSQIGGNIATNAGGIRVLRHGMTREQISGLKVVTGAGELLELNKGLMKNNTGYDLRHLFIGSEGTLGFVVEATVQLAATPEKATVMLLATPRMEDYLGILTTFREHTTLNAFEFFSHNALESVLSQSVLESPFATPATFYVLLEFESPGEQSLADALTAFECCTNEGWVTDGIVASSESQNRSLWQYRERISESIAARTPYKNDIAVRVSQVPRFLQKIDELVGIAYPDFEIVWFGHIGDGNLHLNILKPPEMLAEQFKKQCELVSDDVLAVVQEFDGSVSAEHGIGLMKKEQLHFSRSNEEIASLKSIKRIFDPDGIMNPGKML
ncbi:MAG: FAD-binding oxidoreductase [Proteobacteria bacterium]|nr:FAD-binding oxidoreductase [Pseudomonadota bacterium]